MESTGDVLKKEDGAERSPSAASRDIPGEYTTLDEVHMENPSTESTGSISEKESDGKAMKATLEAMQSQIKMLQAQLMNQDQAKFSKQEAKKSVVQKEEEKQDSDPAPEEEGEGEDNGEEYDEDALLQESTDEAQYNQGEEEEGVVDEEGQEGEEEYEGEEEMFEDEGTECHDEEEEQLEEEDQPGDETDDLFDNLLTQYDAASKPSPAVQAKLATLVTQRCQEPISSEKLKELFHKYVKPENVPVLKETAVNDEVWQNLRGRSRNQDIQIKRMQVKLMKALTCVTTLTDEMMKTKEGYNQGNILTKLTDAIALIGAVNQDINTVRRYLMKPDLRLAYQRVCHLNFEDGSNLLFGKDIDSKVKEMMSDRGRSKSPPFHRSHERRDRSSDKSFSRSRDERGPLELRYRSSERFRGRGRGRGFRGVPRGVPRGRGSFRGRSFERERPALRGETFEGSRGRPFRRRSPRGGFFPRGRGFQRSGSPSNRFRDQYEGPSRKREFRGRDMGAPPRKRSSDFPPHRRSLDRSDSSSIRRSSFPDSRDLEKRFDDRKSFGRGPKPGSSRSPPPARYSPPRRDSSATFSSLNERFSAYNQRTSGAGDYPTDYAQNY